MTQTNAAVERHASPPAGPAKAGIGASAGTLAPAPAAASGDVRAAVVVRGLRKQYGGKAAIDGIDLTVAAGEIVALLGPNGAGKTTTIEILAGRRRRDGGEVRVLGTDPERAGRAWRARIGIVPQTPLAAAEFTVREVVAQFGAFFPDPRDPDEVLAAVGLTGQADTRLRRLSGGQRRRADVAVGLVGRPELLFLDEPTTGFDPQARRRFWDLIGGLAAGGTTILLTTHYLDEAAALASRVAVLAGGRVVADGTPAELRHAGSGGGLATVSWETPAGRRTLRTASPTAAVLDLAERARAEQAAAGQAGTGQAHAGQAPTEQAAAESAGTGQAAAEPAGPEQSGARQAGAGRAHAGQSRTAPAGAELPGLTVTRPSLEDVYLELIGAGQTAGADQEGDQL